MTEEDIAELHRGLLIDSGTKSHTSQFLYAILLGEAEDNPNCSPGIQDLMLLTKMSRRAIQKHLRSLEDLGLVITRRRTDEGGSNLSSEYSLPRLKEALDGRAGPLNKRADTELTRAPLPPENGCGNLPISWRSSQTA